MRRSVFTIATMIGLMACAAVSAAAQDFHNSYPVGPGSRISVSNVSGNVIVKGYEGTAVVVSGFKEGRDRDLVEVEDLSGPNTVQVKVRYPRNCNCDASVKFEVQVPRSVSYNFDHLSTASGDIEVSNVTGDLRIKTASGEVEVKGTAGSLRIDVASGNIRVEDAAGPVSARTASGNVKVEITRLDGSESMEFSSASGNVDVRVPANIDADVEMSTLSGSLSSDFPLHVEQRRYGPGRRATGQVGSGTRRLRINSVSGNVSLSHSR